MTPERKAWIAGYRDGWHGRKPPPEPSYPYQLGWTAGNTDRLEGKPRPAFAPLVEE